jgi:hypothetical protein
MGRLTRMQECRWECRKIVASRGYDDNVQDGRKLEADAILKVLFMPNLDLENVNREDVC